jgi:DNA modification methylase
METNLLYYGDNFDIMKRYIEDESIDLVYLDPPFNSSQNYNVIFDEKDGSKSASQIRAFEDTWHWNLDSQKEFESIVLRADKVSDVMQAFRTFLGTNDMMAYLAMMAPRLIELHRVLKPTGSIYLHCDPTANHYLKILMDAIFGADLLQSQIIWQRVTAHNDKVGFAINYDTILHYSKTEEIIWNPQYQPYDEEYTEKFYRFIDLDSGRRYRLSDMTAAGIRNGESGGPLILDGNTIYPSPGRHWALGLNEGESVQDALNRLYKDGRIQYSPGKMPAYKRYLDEMPGKLAQAIWIDIPPVSPQAKEKLGYPTQKPQALLERIINASSDEGDVVLDPFCGCGTAISAAQHLNRGWIGIDITHLAITLIKSRLKDTFGGTLDYKVIGEPVSLEDASELAKQDPYQFQWWALGLVGARPAEGKKGADKGIDGRILFFESPSDKKAKQIIISVKSGKVSSSHIRDLKGVLEREKAAIGVYISLNPATRDMNEEAANAGFYKSGELGAASYPKVQILTIEDLLDGKTILSPSYVRDREGNRTFKRAPREKKLKKEKNKAVTLDKFFEEDA